MTNLLRLTIALTLAAMPAPAVQALETIYLVRHAEKLDPWPADRYIDAFQPLSETGTRSAQSLARALSDAGVATIYTSRTTRSLQTAIPLWESTGAEVKVESATVEPEKMRDFLAELSTRHRSDKAVLIVSHSNTIPELLIRLGAVPECFERIGIADTPQGLLIEGYEGLWAVDVSGEGCARIHRRTR